MRILARNGYRYLYLNLSSTSFTSTSTSTLTSSTFTITLYLYPLSLSLPPPTQAAKAAHAAASAELQRRPPIDAENIAAKMGAAHGKPSLLLLPALLVLVLMIGTGVGDWDVAAN